jgi:cellulase/cellobiase CelA1
MIPFGTDGMAMSKVLPPQSWPVQSDRRLGVPPTSRPRTHSVAFMGVRLPV